MQSVNDETDKLTIAYLREIQLRLQKFTHSPDLTARRVAGVIAELGRAIAELEAKSTD